MQARFGLRTGGFSDRAKAIAVAPAQAVNMAAPWLTQHTGKSFALRRHVYDSVEEPVYPVSRPSVRLLAAKNGSLTLLRP